jgi:N-dimethylarginine dimethylaminohydrolase
MTRRVLMCPPSFFDVQEVKNPYMGQPINRETALQQWQKLCRTLEESGVKVEIIEPMPGLEDMVFAANPVFVGYSGEVGNFVVPSRMRFPIRQQEVSYYVDWFRKRGYKVIEIDLTNEYLEGQGDLIWHPDHSKIWAGYGFRSTRGGVEKFAQAMRQLQVPVTSLELVDPHCYHLDTCLCPLSEEAVLIYSHAFSPEALSLLRRGWKRIHEMTGEEAHQFIANGIVVDGGYVTPHLTPHLREVLKKEGLQPILVDTSEFEKSGGSAFCMKASLD